MKLAHPLSRGLLSNLPSVFAMSLGIAMTGLSGQAHALAVDSELLLLVDVNNGRLSQRQFSTLMESYASSFTSAEVLTSIQSGNYGRIAVSLMFYGNSTVQTVGIPWMSISNSTEAANFASLATNLSRPVSRGSSAPAPALVAATRSFGTETGNASNGFESSLQLIDIAATSVPNRANSTGVAAAGDAALVAGVDLINTLALGNRSAAISSYYTTNVIGSTIAGVSATTTTSAINQTLAPTMANILAQNVGGNIIAVPEPEPAASLLSAIALVLMRRRRA
jgi:Protein of unknown function (DUF1194)